MLYSKISNKNPKKSGICWPKKIPEMTQKQKIIDDDWQKYFHEVNRKKFSNIVNWGHHYVVENSPPDFISTLEVGPGLGEHLKYERLSDQQKNNYVGIELRENMAEEIRRDYPFVKILIGDCQKNIDYPDGYFDRIIAIHILEHLPNLPMFLKQAYRLLSDKGIFQIVIPCEGGIGYSLGRCLTTKRMFEKRYKLPYKNIIAYEHINTAKEITDEIGRYFTVKNQQWYPLKIHSINLNLVVGLSLQKRKIFAS